MTEQSAPTQVRRRHGHFWRACRFLAPYRRIVIISILCAFGVGFLFTTGLGAMLPILRVLLNGDTVQQWVSRHVAEHRLGVRFVDDAERLVVIRVVPTKAAHEAGLEQGMQVLPEMPADEAASMIAQAPHGATVELATGTATLEAVPFHLSLAMQIAQRLPEHPVAVIAAIFGIIAGLALLGNLVRFFQEYLSDKAAIGAVNDIRRHLYDHVLHMPLEFFGLRGTSDVTSRLVQDSQGLQDGFKTVLGQTIQEPIKAAFAFTLSTWISWKLTLFIIVFAPLMAVVIRKLGKKMRRASRAALENSSSMLGQIEGTLTGIRVVKGASAERFERRRYTSIIQQLRKQQLRMARYEAWATPAMETIALLLVGAVLMLASYMVLVSQTLDSSSFFVVLACMVSMGESLRRLSKVNNVLQRSNAAAGRIFEIMDIPVERPRGVLSPRAASTLHVLSPIRNEIRFENVSFTYANAPAPAVAEVTLVVPRGRSVAIVGRNGSGKTTLLSLLPRFFDPDEGRILIDGIDIRTVTLRSLRRQIAVVTQDSVIFPGTIADNIAYGDSRPDRDAIINAAKRAFAHDFIMDKPQGYDTPLDGLGGQLSGGQKQRINIARAIFRKSPILILDEATSQVDAESEHLIQQAIESLMHERTTFVIAHRLNTILSADLIVVMDRGQIVGQGTHEELLRTCPTYEQLYERQLFATPRSEPVAPAPTT